MFRKEQGWREGVYLPKTLEKFRGVDIYYLFFIITRKIWEKVTRNLKKLKKKFLGRSRDDRKGFSLSKYWKNLVAWARIFSFSSLLGKFERNLQKIWKNWKKNLGRNRNDWKGFSFPKYRKNQPQFFLFHHY